MYSRYAIALFPVIQRLSTRFAWTFTLSFLHLNIPQWIFEDPNFLSASEMGVWQLIATKRLHSTLGQVCRQP
uniref:Uncharacterized protein n=1 Tax=Rhizophora mucronata TaxID=61149 RepID=A0A2P2IMS1_RHIMU